MFSQWQPNYPRKPIRLLDRGGRAFRLAFDSWQLYGHIPASFLTRFQTYCSLTLLRAERKALAQGHQVGFMPRDETRTHISLFLDWHLNHHTKLILIVFKTNLIPGDCLHEFLQISWQDFSQVIGHFFLPGLKQRKWPKVT